VSADTRVAHAGTGGDAHAASPRQRVNGTIAKEVGVQRGDGWAAVVSCGRYWVRGAWHVRVQKAGEAEKHAQATKAGDGCGLHAAHAPALSRSMDGDFSRRGSRTARCG